MMARRDVLNLLLGAGSALLTACGRLGGHRYRYKLTIEVDTPRGICSGFAVRQVDWAEGRKITPEASTASMTHIGEAAMVDLPNSDTLFALMSPSGQETPMLAFGSARQTSSSDRSVRVLKLPAGPEAICGDSGFPRLVRFADIADPSTVEKVDPARLVDSFGEGYRLLRITAQIVEDQVTEQVSDRLPWLKRYRNLMLDGERYHRVQSSHLASHLNTLDFKRNAI